MAHADRAGAAGPAVGLERRSNADVSGQSVNAVGGERGGRARMGVAASA